MKIFVRGDRTVSVAVEPCQSVESLVSTIEEATGQLWLSMSRSQHKKDPNSAKALLSFVLQTICNTT
jgi:hypothetical protein